jgi:quinol monooxygenase YgiN
MMILSCIELVPAQDKRRQMLEILQFAENGVRRNPGCTWCGIYESHDPDSAILYLEQWESERDLRTYVRSKAYLPILNAIDMAREQPKVNFYDVGSTRSMELIELLRAPQTGDEPRKDRFGSSGAQGSLKNVGEDQDQRND